MEDIGGIVRRFPTFGQIRLDDEGARPNFWTDFMPQELAVHEAQHGLRPLVTGEMRIEVHRISPAHAQDASALGRCRFFTPEYGRAKQWPGRQCYASGETRLQQLTTA